MSRATNSSWWRPSLPHKNSPPSGRPQRRNPIAGGLERRQGGSPRSTASRNSPSRNEGELRARREGAAIAYLAENGADEGPVRFDDVSLVIVAPDRALVRHHINSLSVAEESLGGKEALTEVA